MRMLPIALVLALFLSGCSPHGTIALPIPEPSSAPVFASDEEALAAAKMALAAYIAVSDAISQDGGANPERMASVVTPEWLPTELNSYIQMVNAGKRQIGTTTFTNSELQRVSDLGGGRVDLTMYTCVDLTSSQIVDSSGKVQTGAPSYATLEVSFQLRGNQGFLLSGSELWSGESLC